MRRSIHFSVRIQRKQVIQGEKKKEEKKQDVDFADQLPFLRKTEMSE